MKKLEQEYTVERFDIKADKKVLKDYTRILSERNYLNIRTKKEIISVSADSIHFICTLSQNNIEETIWFLYEDKENTSTDGDNNNQKNNDNNISIFNNSSIQEINIPVVLSSSTSTENTTISPEVQQRPVNRNNIKNTKSTLKMIVMILNLFITLLMICHWVMYMIGDYFAICAYFISCSILVLIFTTLNWWYCNDCCNNSHTNNWGRLYIIFHVLSIVFTVVSGVFAFWYNVSGELFSQYVEEHRWWFVFCYFLCFGISIVGFWQAFMNWKNNDERYQEFTNDEIVITKTE